MKIRLVGLLLPMYQATNHYGATPIAYKRGTVDALEKALIDRSKLVLRTSGIEQLSSDTQPGGAHSHKLMRVYSFNWDSRTSDLGEIVGLALKLYDLKTVTVILDEETRELTEDDAQNLIEGLDAWSPEEV